MGGEEGGDEGGEEGGDAGGDAGGEAGGEAIEVPSLSQVFADVAAETFGTDRYTHRTITHRTITHRVVMLHAAT